MQFWQKALHLYLEIKNRKGELKVSNNLGKAYLHLSQYEKSLFFHEKSLAIARDIKDKLGEMDSLMYLEYLFDVLRNYEKAISYVEQRLSISREIKDQDQERILLEDLGGRYYRLSKYHKAMEFYEQALLISSEKEHKISTWIQLSKIYRTLRDESKNYEYYRLNDIKQKSEINSQRVSLFQEETLSRFKFLPTYLSRLDVLKDTSINILYERSKEEISEDKQDEKKLEIIRNNKDKLEEINFLFRLISKNSYLKKYIKVSQYSEQISELIRKSDGVIENYNMSFLLLQLGDAYYSVGNYHKSIAYYKQILAIDRKTKFISIQTLKRLGLLYSLTNSYDEAISYYQEIHSMLREGIHSGWKSRREEEEENLISIATILEKQKKPELSIIFYKEAVRVYESIRFDNRTLPQNLKESYAQLISKTYRSLANLLLSQGRVLEAQQVLELLKNQELQDYTKETRSTSPTNGSPLNPLEAPIPAAFNDKISLGNQPGASRAVRPG